MNGIPIGCVTYYKNEIMAPASFAERQGTDGVFGMDGMAWHLRADAWRAEPREGYSKTRLVGENLHGKYSTHFTLLRPAIRPFLVLEVEAKTMASGCRGTLGESPAPTKNSVLTELVEFRRPSL